MVGEAFFLGVAGLATGLLAGALVGIALLQILAGVFDPPADAPAIPLTLIGAMAGVIGLALVAAVAFADRGLSRLSVVAALRER
jgi:ABC-type antimicrobial peptide transport system permease subunit